MNCYVFKKFNEKSISTLNLLGFLLYIIVDPDREVFKTVLYQNACYLFEIKDEEILYLVKDITRFKNRDIRRSVILDPKPTNYMMAPENSLPTFEYTAEYHVDN